MSATTRFGSYLLFKKLSEDTLGETYRAGLLAGSQVSDIVLLRVFGRPGTDAGKLAQVFEESRPKDHDTTGLGVSYALETGQVGGLAYATYEYVPGRDLATLYTEANSGFESLSEDHSILIVERVAKGLSLLQTSIPEEVIHGFVVPQLIWVSNEGEARLFGFEAGHHLAAMAAAGHLGPEITPFLSPEVLSGAKPGPADDVYSLGATLWFLLLGSAPSAAAGPYEAQLQNARLEASGEAVPAGLVRLLQRSLAPASERIASAEGWHRELIGWMAESSSSATTFDLAFFLHEIFRDEIRREASEIGEEKELDLQKPEPTPAPASTETSSAPTPAAAQPPPPDTGAIPTEAETSSGSKAGPMLIAAAVLIAIAVGAVYWFMLRPAPPPPPETTVAETPPPPTAPPPPAFDLAAAEEALQTLMDERRAEMDERLQEEYSNPIEELQRQIAEARKEPENPPPSPPPTFDTSTGTAADAQAAEPAGGETREPEAETSSPPSPSTPPPPAATPPPPAATPPPPAAPPPTPQDTDTTAGETETAERDPQPPPPPARATPPPPAEAAPPPPPEPVVTIPPRMRRRAEPKYPEIAKRAGRQGTVVLRVLVGKDGKPLKVEPISPPRKDLGLSDAAVQAALNSRYEPARRGDEPIEMWTTLTYTFKL